MTDLPLNHPDVLVAAPTRVEPETRPRKQRREKRVQTQPAVADIPPPSDGPEKQPQPGRKRWPVVVAIGAVAASVAGVIAVNVWPSKGGNKVQATSSSSSLPVGNIPSSPTTPDTLPSVMQTTIPGSVSGEGSGTTEIIGKEPTPIIGSDPHDLVRKLYENYECALNADASAEKRRCITYISGDPDNAVGKVFEDAADKADPSHTYDISAFLVDSRSSSGGVEASVEVYDGTGPRYFKKYVFAPALVPDPNSEGEQVNAMVVISTESITEQEAHFN